MPLLDIETTVFKTTRHAAKDSKTLCGLAISKKAILTMLPFSIPIEDEAFCGRCANVLARKHYRNLELKAREQRGEPYTIFTESYIKGLFSMDTFKAESQIQALHKAKSLLKGKAGFLLASRDGKFL